MKPLSLTLLASLESIINKALEFDPASQQRLTHMSGRVLAIQVTAPESCVYVMPQQNGISLMSQWDGEVDARLTGSLVALAKLPLSDTHNLHDTGVSFMGNTQVIAGFNQLAQDLDIDWEEIIATLAGDVAGPQIAKVIRANMHWARDRGASAARLGGEFLTHELNALPSRAQLQAFYQDVDAMRFDLDRVQAKLHLFIANNKSVI